MQQDSLDSTIYRVFENFDGDYRTISEHVSTIFDGAQQARFQTEQTMDFIQSWEKPDGQISGRPSITALVFYALQRLGFTAEDKSLVLPCLAVSVLAEIENNLAYHNNAHYFKVTLHAVRLVFAHNRIFKGTRSCLGKPEMAMVVAAAAMHDLGHRGESNIIDRKYHAARLEIRSFDYASPYLRQCGFNDSMLDDIKIMLYTTDASPFGDPISPSNQMRAAYEYHYGTSDADEDLNLGDDLKVLEEREMLCMLCMLLHEADLMNSCGVSYEFTCHESILIGREMGKDFASPEDTLLFLTMICWRGMVSDAAKFLAGENFAVIYDRVRQDFQNGNKPYR